MNRFIATDENSNKRVKPLVQVNFDFVNSGTTKIVNHLQTGLIFGVNRFWHTFQVPFSI